MNSMVFPNISSNTKVSININIFLLEYMYATLSLSTLQKNIVQLYQ